MRMINWIMLVIFSIPCFAQTAYIDSVKNKLHVKMPDTMQVNLLIDISKAAYAAQNRDSGYAFASRAADLAKTIHWSLGEARGVYFTIPYSLFRQHNFSKSFSDALYAHVIFQTANDTTWMMNTLGVLGTIALLSEEFAISISYYQQLHAVSTPAGDLYRNWESMINIGDCYYFMQQPDSAGKYYQEAFRLGNSMMAIEDTVMIKGWSYLGMARHYRLQQETGLALSHARKAQHYANQIAGRDLTNLKGTLQTVFYEVFMDMKRWDSALVHAKSEEGDGEIHMGTVRQYNAIALIYEHLNKDSSIRYYKLGNDLRQQLFSDRTKAEMANIRQSAIEQQVAKKLEDEHRQSQRRKNIQYTGIAIGLATLLIFFTVFSRSIVANARLIRFLGVVVLLIVFEFINLFIHPFVSEKTHDSPLLMLLVMVVVASLLVPAHHRIAHWVSHQLVEKNKRIRLEAARKTIQQLEG